MPQTTTQVSQSCGAVWVSTDCTNWTLITGNTQSVSGVEQGRMAGDAYTLAGDTALVAGGKRTPMDITVVIIYTETDAEAYEVIRTWWESTDCGDLICVRWSPRGGNAGDEQITSAEGVITSFTYPALDASAAGVIMGGFTLHTPYVTTSIIAS